MFSRNSAERYGYHMNTYYSFDNFDLDLNGSSFQIIIWGLYIGVVLGTLGSILFRVYSGKIIRALINASADGENSAKTLAELGLEKNFLIRKYLRDDSVLRRSVLSCGDTLLPPSGNKFKIFWYETFLRTDIPRKTNFNTAKFYLPEENRSAAELRFREESHPVRNFILAAAGLLAVTIFVSYALPELLTMLDNFITQVKPESKYY